MIKNLFRRKNTDLAERQLDLEERKLKQQQKMLQMMQQEQQAAPASFAPPELMQGVVPAGRKAAIAMDSCQSIYDYSTIGDPTFYSTFLGYPALAAMSQSSDYRSVAETTATEMTREWGRFKVDDNSGGNDEDLTDAEREKKELEEKRVKAKRVEKINQLTDAFKLHNIRTLVQRAIEVEYTMGRAQIYIKLKDGKDDLPFVLDKSGVKQGDLEGFRLIEPMWSTPSVYNAADPTSADFYKPTKWFVLGREVHADRLLTLIMRPVPDMLKPAYNFGGISMLQLMKPYVERYQRTADSVAQIVRAFSLTILSTDMSAILSGGEGSASLWLRAGLFNKGRDNTGLMLLDKEAEEISQINTPLTSLPELLTKSQEQMAAPSHTPLVKLLGVTPSGLNANSDGEIRVYYDYIMAQNEAHIRPMIEKISYLMQLSMFGEIDPAIVWEFNPLYQLNEKEIAETQEIKMRTAGTGVEKGIVSPLEARQALAADEDSAFNTIDVSDVPESMEYGFEDSAENVTRRIGADSALRPLYIHRKIENGEEIVNWAKSQGLESITDASDMHVTVAFSKKSVNWSPIEATSQKNKIISSDVGFRAVQKFGDEPGVVVLEFRDNTLESRHEAIKEMGASWDWPEYRPHITVSHKAEGVDISSIDPYVGHIELGPEVFEPLDENWKAKVVLDEA